MFYIFLFDRKNIRLFACLFTCVSICFIYCYVFVLFVYVFFMRLGTYREKAPDQGYLYARGSACAMEQEAPQGKDIHQEIEQIAEKMITVRLIYNYEEQIVQVPVVGDSLMEIQRKAHELFSLSCIRLEIEHKPLTSIDQLIASSGKVTVCGTKSKCMLLSCRNRPIVSLLCKYCSKAFCQLHSIPEEHKCDKIAICHKEAAQKNKRSLLQGSLHKEGRF